MSTDPAYEHSAHYYDAAYGAVPSLGPDANFYRELAARSGGKVLELGCGTGRVLLPISAQGTTCVGVDKSPAMLEQFRSKPGAGAVTLTCSPMESFDLNGQRFRLVFSAFRAFQHLDTVEQQLACLARVRAHLEPGGMFAFDVFNPRVERMVAENEAEALDIEFNFKGRAVKRFTSISRDRAKQLMEVTMRYVEDGGARPATETVVTFSMRWFWRYELEHLMHRAGFSNVTIYGDFDQSAVDRNSPAFVVLAS
jgi:ubiquinone/menaquinone biosynthesis C-methylase UbiE